jgi:cystathionine beta-lyase
MGSVTTRDEALHLKLKLAHMRLGLGVAGNDAELVLRSLPSTALRYHAHDRAARALASWLQARPEIARVLHPALPGAPGHAHWQATCSAAAGLFSVLFDARYGAAQVDRFVDALRLFRIGYSWGGPVSLVVPYDLATMRIPVPYEGTLVRFSIGLEAVADLQADLAQALSVF